METTVETYVSQIGKSFSKKRNVISTSVAGSTGQAVLPEKGGHIESVVKHLLNKSQSSHKCTVTYQYEEYQLLIMHLVAFQTAAWSVLYDIPI